MTVTAKFEADSIFRIAGDATPHAPLDLLASSFPKIYSKGLSHNLAMQSLSAASAA